MIYGESLGVKTRFKALTCSSQRAEYVYEDKIKKEARGVMCATKIVLTTMHFKPGILYMKANFNHRTSNLGFFGTGKMHFTL